MEPGVLYDLETQLRLETRGSYEIDVQRPATVIEEDAERPRRDESGAQPSSAPAPTSVAVLWADATEERAMDMLEMDES